MGETQLGVEFADGEVSDIVAFLGSLEGEKPELTTRFFRHLQIKHPALMRIDLT